MRTRVTFRIPPELADSLRELPNQTAFVERALREALAKNCPVCAGTGRVTAVPVRITSVRQTAAFPLTRATALQLKRVISVARQLAATDVELHDSKTNSTLNFKVARGGEVLLRGTLAAATLELQ